MTTSKKPWFKDKRFTFRLTAISLRRFKKYASDNGQSLSEVIINLLRKAVNNER